LSLDITPNYALISIDYSMIPEFLKLPRKIDATGLRRGNEVGKRLTSIMDRSEAVEKHGWLNAHRLE
jgi:hypothetical protein